MSTTLFQELKVNFDGVTSTLGISFPSPLQVLK